MAEFQLYHSINAVDISQEQDMVVVGGNQILQVYRALLDNNTLTPKLELYQDVGGTNLTTNDVKWSLHDNGRFASASSSGVVKVWDVHRSRPFRVLQEHSLSANKVSWSQIVARRLISGSQTGEVKLWDLRAGEKSVSTFITKGNEGNSSVFDIHFNPHDEFNFASAYRNNTIQIWDTRYHKKCKLNMQSAHKGNVLTVSWHPQLPGILASGGADSTIRVWDLRCYIDNGDTSTAGKAGEKRPPNSKIQPIYKVTTSGKVLKVRWRPGFDTQLVSASTHNMDLLLWDLQYPSLPAACFPGHKSTAMGFEFTAPKPFTEDPEDRVHEESRSPNDLMGSDSSSMSSAFDPGSAFSQTLPRSGNLVSPALPSSGRRQQLGPLDLLRTPSLEHSYQSRRSRGHGARFTRQNSVLSTGIIDGQKTRRRSPVVRKVTSEWAMDKLILSYTPTGVLRFHHFDEANQLLNSQRGLGVSISILGEVSCVHDPVSHEHTDQVLTKPCRLVIEPEEIDHVPRAVGRIKVFRGKPVAWHLDEEALLETPAFPQFSATAQVKPSSSGAVLGFDAERFTYLAKRYKFPTLKMEISKQNHVELKPAQLTDEELSRYCEHNARIAAEANSPHLCQMWLTVKLLMVPESSNLALASSCANSKWSELDNKEKSIESSTDSSEEASGSTGYSADETQAIDESEDGMESSDSSHTSYSSIDQDGFGSPGKQLSEMGSSSEDGENVTESNSSQRATVKGRNGGGSLGRSQRKKDQQGGKKHVRWVSQKNEKTRRSSKQPSQTQSSESKIGTQQEKWWDLDLFENDSFLDESKNISEEVPGLMMKDSVTILSMLHALSPLPGDAFEVSGRYAQARDALELEAVSTQPALSLVADESTPEARRLISRRHSKAFHQVRSYSQPVSEQSNRKHNGLNHGVLFDLGDMKECIPGGIGELSSVIIHDILKHHAEQGDVQTCVSLTLIVGNRLEPRLSEERIHGWFDAYVDLLQRLKLHTVATYVNSNCPDEKVRRNYKNNAYYRSGCTRCGEPFPEEASSTFCFNCSCPSVSCSICNLQVKGTLAWCQGCRHGGHLMHMSKWFKNNSLCPSGCGHKCSIPGVTNK